MVYSNPFGSALHAAWLELSGPNARGWYHARFKATGRWILGRFQSQPEIAEVPLLPIVAVATHEQESPVTLDVVSVECPPLKSFATQAIAPSETVVAAPLFTLEELQAMRVKELRKLARAHAIKIADGTSISNARKGQLIEALSTA